VTKSSKKSHKSEFNVILPPAVTIDYILFYHSKVWGFQFLKALEEVYIYLIKTIVKTANYKLNMFSV